MTPIDREVKDQGQTIKAIRKHCLVHVYILRTFLPEIDFKPGIHINPKKYIIIDFEIQRSEDKLFCTSENIVCYIFWERVPGCYGYANEGLKDPLCSPFVRLFWVIFYDALCILVDCYKVSWLDIKVKSLLSDLRAHKFVVNNWNLMSHVNPWTFQLDVPILWSMCPHFILIL